MAQRTQMAIEWSAVVAAVALVVTLIVTLRRAPAGQVEVVPVVWTIRGLH